MRAARFVGLVVLLMVAVMVFSSQNGGKIGGDEKRGKEVGKSVNLLGERSPEDDPELEKANDRFKVKIEEIEKENMAIRDREASLRDLLQQAEEEKAAALLNLKKAKEELEKRQTCATQNQALSLPKSPVICKDPRSKGRPIFIFVVGGEGTGHHLVANLVDKFPGVQSMTRHIQQLFAEMWEPAINEERRFEKRAELVSLLKVVADEAAADPTKGTHFVIQTKNFDMYSFPYDEPRNSLRRPDVIDLISLVEPHFDLRILVTLRDPMTSIVSLIRRKWWTMKMCEEGVPVPTRKVRLYTEGPLGECGLIPVQARVVEDALVYINAQLRAISKEFFKTFRYEKFLDQPETFVTPLANFLGFKPDDISKQVTNHVQKRVEDYTQMLSEKQRAAILSIFGRKERPIYWQEMEEEELDLLNAEKGEAKWKERELCFA